MRQPLSLFPTFCLGIIFAFGLTNLSWLWLLWIIVPVSIVCVRYSRLVLLFFVFIIGMSYSLLRIEHTLSQRLPLSQNRQIQTLEIVVEDLVRQEDYGTRFQARVLHPAADIPHKIVLTDYEKQDWPSGSQWRIQARLRVPVGAVNQAGFHTEAYYLSQSIGAVGSVQKGRIYQGESYTPKARLDRYRSALAHRIRVVGVEYPRGAAIIAALTIGEQHIITDDDWRAFSQTGITHLVSISGLHVTMIALFAAWLAKSLLHILPVRLNIQPRTIMLLSGITAALIYAMLAGFSVPTQRSVFMLSAVAVLMLSRHYFTPWQIWWIALSVVLLISPLAVLSLGFWLSFGLVAGLLWISVNRRQLNQNRWWLACKGQMAATISSIVPLSYFFGQIPLVSPLVNTVAIPWVSWCLTPFALIALCLPIDTPLIWVCALAEHSLYALDSILPFAYQWIVPKLPLSLLILGGISTLLLLAPIGAPMKGLSVISLLLVVGYQPEKPETDTALITVLDVGQGSSMLVQTQNHSLLFDTGASRADWIVLPNLRAQGIHKLDMLVLSHNDIDHDAGLDDIVRVYPTTNIMAGQPQAYPSFPVTQYCQQGQKWQWDGVGFEWLTLNINSTPSDNNNQSCVLKITAQNQSLLITGDLSAKGERKLIEQFNNKISAQILILGHHGSANASSKAFLAAVQPRFVVSSSGFANHFNHPNQKIRARLEEKSITLLRTDEQGAIHIKLSADLHIFPIIRSKPFWQVKPL